ncbi:hypothetical protein ACBY01_03740 [Sphingomonas sp. ac-8]|uniref:hypothetical protein n=1 Tax=Sphingomonas sp. ac-8 TaxID=3242977 RepID=UPI003A80DFB9
MSFAVFDRRVARFATALSLTLAIAACGTEPAPVADNETAGVTPTAHWSPRARTPEPEGVDPPSATLAELGDDLDGVETPGMEIPGTQAYGRWMVVDAAGPASGRAMIGRTLTFTEEKLGWTDASGKVEAGCPDHVYHIAWLAAHVKQAAPLFRPGWAKFRLPPGDVGPMHVWECGATESLFGPAETSGSVFFPVGTDRLVMNWMDGAVLLLRKEGKKA